MPIVRLLLAALLLAAHAWAATEDLPCRYDLVPCNLGQSFSGTFSWTTTLEFSGGKTTEEVRATIVGGRVSCDGSVVSSDPGAAAGPIRGEGLLVVETGVGDDDHPGAPWYRVAVACPGPDGSPARIEGGQRDTYHQLQKGGVAVLEGSIDEENPDADEINGVTGRVKISWSLRSAKGAR